MKKMFNVEPITYYTVSDLAREAGVLQTTLFNWVYRSRPCSVPGPETRIGRRNYYSPETYRAALEIIRAKLERDREREAERETKAADRDRELYTVTDLARGAGLPVNTVFTRIYKGAGGLLPAPETKVGRRHFYSPETYRAALAMIRAQETPTV